MLKSADLINWLKSTWPNERDWIARPERLKYLKRAADPETCVFCASRDQGIKVESLCVYQSKHAMVILNKFPYNTGHLLVLPKKHVAAFTDFSLDEYQDLQVLLKATVDVLYKAYQPSGMNVGLNLGKVAGAGLPDHLHWHVIPRWAGDTNFFPIIAETKVIPETLEQTFNKLYPLFK